VARFSAPEVARHEDAVVAVLVVARDHVDPLVERLAAHGLGVGKFAETPTCGLSEKSRAVAGHAVDAGDKTFVQRHIDPNGFAGKLGAREKAAHFVHLRVALDISRRNGDLLAILDHTVQMQVKRRLRIGEGLRLRDARRRAAGYVGKEDAIAFTRPLDDSDVAGMCHVNSALRGNVCIDTH